MTLKERIRMLANSKGLSLPNLENKLGFGNGTIIKWDKSIPNADKLTKVADYFDVSIDYLIGREGDEAVESDAIRKVKILTRKTEEHLTKEERDELIKHYEDSINIYLKAKGIDIDK